MCPAVGELNARLGRLGAAGRLMSGSGTTLFALCRDPDEAQRLASELTRLPRELVARVHVVRTL